MTASVPEALIVVGALFGSIYSILYVTRPRAIHGPDEPQRVVTPSDPTRCWKCGRDGKHVVDHSDGLEGWQCPREHTWVVDASGEEREYKTLPETEEVQDDA